MEIDIFNTDKKYQIIYADPAWDFKNKKTGGSHKSGAASKYKTTTLADMKNLPVAKLADDNCILIMWWVSSMPQEALDLATAWGFKVKSMNGFIWDKETKNGKDHFGMGHYTRPQCEAALIAIKGKTGDNIVNHSVRQKVRALKPKEHSAKPRTFRDIIVELAGDKPRIELFSRGNHSGWDVWGDEVEKNITG